MKDFKQVIMTAFSDEINNPDFISSVAKKLARRPYRLIEILQKSVNEKRARSGFTIDEKQTIYNEWLENNIPSVDCRNGREMINMKKGVFLLHYKDIETGSEIEERANKRGIAMVSAPRRITICTVRKLQLKLEGKNMNTSLGTILHLKPFFMRNPTEKEREMFLHRYFLNLRLEFNAVMEHSKMEWSILYIN